MKTFKQFVQEDILDDIIKDVSSDSGKKSPPRKSVQKPAHKQNKPITFKGEFYKGSPSILKNENDLKRKLKEFGYDTNIEGIAKLFAEHHIAPSESIQLDLKTKDVNEYKEFDRSLIDDWSGKMTKDEFDDLMKSIKKVGIKNPVMIKMKKDSKGNVHVLLNEGNHRLAIAKELKISRIPVQFFISS